MQFLTLVTTLKTSLISLFLRIPNPDSAKVFLMILWGFLAFLSLFLIILFFKRLYFSSKRIFSGLLFAAVAVSAAWGMTQVITENKYTEPVIGQFKNQPTEKAGSGIGSEADAAKTSGVSPKTENKITLEKLAEVLGLRIDENGHPAGDLLIKPTGKLELKNNSVGSGEIKDHSIGTHDIDHNSVLETKGLETSGGIVIDGNSTFRGELGVLGEQSNSSLLTLLEGLEITGGDVEFSTSGTIAQTGTGQVTLAGNLDATAGVDVSGGNLTVGGSNFVVNQATGNITAGTYNGNTITAGTGTLTLSSYVLALSGNAALNQNLLTTSAPTFVTLNTGQGAYELYAMDQNVLTTSSPTFATLNLTTLDLGTNTIADQNFNGNWSFNGGNLTNVGSIQSSGLGLSGNLDMQNNLVLNIGNAGTDFDSSGGLALAGNLSLSGTNPIINLSSASTLNINTTTNRPVTFGTGLVTVPNFSVTNSQGSFGTMSITSDSTTSPILSITGNYLTSGTGIIKTITANAGNGQITTGEQVSLTDSTVNGGGYTGIGITVSGSGTGSGNKYLLDLNAGTNKEVVFDSAGAFRPTAAVSSNTNTIGSPSFYWKNGYFDQITANSLSGTVVTGATSSTTWTIGSSEAGDVNEAVIFQRNSGSGNATLEWNKGASDLRYLSVNYPFNSTYTVSDGSISTGINLFSGNLTNNTTSGTQKLLSLTNTGTGTTETGIYLNNTGTSATGIEIAGTWTSGIVTNNNTINAGSGAVTAGSYNNLTLTANADGFSVAGGTTSRTLAVIGGNITLTATDTTNVTLPTTGTLATLAGAETFTNKTGYNGLVITANTGVITTGTWNGTSIDDAHIDNNLTLAGGTISGAANTMSLGTDATGDIYYRDASGYLARLAIGAAGTILQSGTIPAWSTATYPSAASGTGTFLRANGTNWVASTSTLADTFGINTLLYASAANTVSGLATGNNGVLITSAGGVPSISSTLPTAVQQNITNASSALATGLLQITTTTGALSSITASAGISGLLSDETGSGALVFAESPSLTTPNIGAATATSVNGLTITSSNGTLTIASGKIFTSSNTLTFSGTDSASLNIGLGGTLGTAAYTASTDYALLAGRSGGQTLIGGTAATDDLVLQSTSGTAASGAYLSLKTGANGSIEALRIDHTGAILYPDSNAQPRRTIVLTGAGATAPTTNGAAQTKVDGTNSSYYTLDFDASTDESAYWQWVMPDSYNGGTVSVTFYWEASAVSGNVVWAAQTAGVASGAAEDIDPTLGTASTVTSTAAGNANDLTSAAISSFTTGWAAGDYIVFRAYRDADNVSDTMTGDASLVKVKIEYAVNAESD